MDADEHAPLVTTALYDVVAVNAPVAKVAVVAPVTAAYVPTVVPVTDALYHAMVPVDPVSVNVEPVFGVHNAFVPEIVPATDG